jgi:hypothetical protein
MNRITSFAMRLAFLEVHPAIVGCIILTPIALTGIYSYSLTQVDKMSKEFSEDIQKIQARIESDYEHSLKHENNYDKIMRPNKYA